MDYCEIGEFAEEYSAHRVNEKIKLGWIVLGVFQRGDRLESGTVYVLGWPKSQGEPIYHEPSAGDFDFGTEYN